MYVKCKRQKIFIRVQKNIGKYLQFCFGKHVSLYEYFYIWHFYDRFHLCHDLCASCLQVSFMATQQDAFTMCLKPLNAQLILDFHTHRQFYQLKQVWIGSTQFQYHFKILNFVSSYFTSLTHHLVVPLCPEELQPKDLQVNRLTCAKGGFVWRFCMSEHVCCYVQFFHTVSIPDPPCSRAPESVNRGFPLPRSLPNSKAQLKALSMPNEAGEGNGLLTFSSAAPNIDLMLGAVGRWAMMGNDYFLKENNACTVCFTSE